MLNFDGYNVPAHTQQALTDYIEKGYEPGGFLFSVLCNDLFAAVGSADSSNMAALKEIILWVYNCAPCECWGGEAKVMRYIAKQRAETVA